MSLGFFLVITLKIIYRRDRIITERMCDMNEKNDKNKNLCRLIIEAENAQKKNMDTFYRLQFHLMPPVGWMNDPNGLCQFDDEYHIFFQYSPLHVHGGMKAWGHYVTKDFVTYKYCGAPFLPDESFDTDGVFSGSAYVDKNGMHIFYTGNVELPGDYDYTTAGRLADTVLIESKDGYNFSEKEVVIPTSSYPETYSCHIRDPKVWKENAYYYMVLGGRTREDQGKILVYRSDDLRYWSLLKELKTRTPFAYMWECPDLYKLESHYVLSFSPQGIEREEYRYQNIYHAGYFVTDTNPITNDFSYESDSFREWDMGFDFYAPQSFLDNQGRRIMIGWVGVPYAQYQYAEVAENWQHCLTIPRCLRIGKAQGEERTIVYQYPIEEINQLRTNQLKVENYRIDCDDDGMDILVEGLEGPFSITLFDEISFSYENDTLMLSLSDEIGYGRDCRKCKIKHVKNLRILLDVSLLEIFVNDGEYVFTSRFYKKEHGTHIQFDCKDAKIYAYIMKRIEIS